MPPAARCSLRGRRAHGICNFAAGRTDDRVKEQSIRVRKFKRVGLIMEYKDLRAISPPPLIILELLASLLYRIVHVLCFARLPRDQDLGFSNYVPQRVVDKRLEAERQARTEFLRDHGTLATFSELQAVRA